MFSTGKSFPDRLGGVLLLRWNFTALFQDSGTVLLRQIQSRKDLHSNSVDHLAGV